MECELKDTFTSFDYDDIDFEVLFDNLIENKDSYMLLSLINDFESGMWKIDDFTDFILSNMAETALTFKEREALGEKASNNIRTCCKRIATIQKNDTSKNKGEGGEFGEAFLHGVLKKYYKAFPVNPKIFYKQNINDNPKGADSVHITQDNGGNFHLWLGESKFYTNLASAISNAIQSIKDLFNDEKLKKEKSLIMGIGELRQYAEKNNLLDNEKYQDLEKILNHKTSLDKLKKILHIPISIIYECKNTQNTKEITEDYKEYIKKFHYTEAKNIQKKLDQALDKIYGISNVKFHVILFPIPNKHEAMEKLTKVVKAYS